MTPTHARLVLSILAALALPVLGCKSSNGAPSDSPPPIAKAPGLPARQFFLHVPFGPGEQRPSGIVFSRDVDDGEIWEIGVDAVRAKLSVKEQDGSFSVVTSRPAIYREIETIATPSLRATCATEVEAIDRGRSVVGNAYAYDTTKGSRLVCWTNLTKDPKTVWREIEVASTRGEADKDMLWSFAMTGARSAPEVDVVYARDAEWGPQFFHGVGRREREKGFERTISVASGAPALAALFDGDFPDFAALQAAQLGRGFCTDRCGWAWDGASWQSCGNTCGAGEACVKGFCQANATCTPLTKEQVCDGNACGQYSDGCGGRIDCGDPCAAQQKVCGAGGVYRRCGKRLEPLTPDEVRKKHGDTGSALCGVFTDPLASDVDLGGCTDGKACVDNLCQ